MYSYKFLPSPENYKNYRTDAVHNQVFALFSSTYHAYVSFCQPWIMMLGPNFSQVTFQLTVQRLPYFEFRMTFCYPWILHLASSSLYLTCLQGLIYLIMRSYYLSYILEWVYPVHLSAGFSLTSMTDTSLFVLMVCALNPAYLPLAFHKAQLVVLKTFLTTLIRFLSLQTYMDSQSACMLMIIPFLQSDLRADNHYTITTGS
jgi:Mg/Co/Ni transporter MgtE